MKNDMGGAAAIFGAAKAIAEIKPLGVEVKHQICSLFSVIKILIVLIGLMGACFPVPKQIHFVVAACENMISATGMRPSDIVTASNGKTIEVYILGFIDPEKGSLGYHHFENFCFC